MCRIDRVDSMDDMMLRDRIGSLEFALGVGENIYRCDGDAMHRDRVDPIFWTPKHDLNDSQKICDSSENTYRYF